MFEKERMLAGKLYKPQGEALRKDSRKARKLTRAFNATTEEELNRRREILNDLFASVGENIYIEPPFHCDYGCHIHIGKNFYSNYDCIILDVCDVTIGDYVFFGPRVNIFTANHPIDVEVRNEDLQYGSPITIGNNVWVGGNTVLNPGVTIGDNVVIGSGSVVTKNIPSNVIAMGNPCKVLREITQQDKEYWQKQKEEYDKAVAEYEKI